MRRIVVAEAYEPTPGGKYRRCPETVNWGLLRMMYMTAMITRQEARQRPLFEILADAASASRQAACPLRI